MKVVLYTTILGKPKSANSSVIVPEVATESLQTPYLPDYANTYRKADALYAA